MQIKLFTAAAIAVIMAGCDKGGRIEVSNDSGSPITAITITVSGLELGWESIEPGEVVSERIAVPFSGRLIVGYTSGTAIYNDTLSIPEGCGDASSVSVWISGDATSVKYNI